MISKNSQVNLTFNYFQEAIGYKNFYLKNNERVKYLLSKYNLNSFYSGRESDSTNESLIAINCFDIKLFI